MAFEGPARNGSRPKDVPLRVLHSFRRQAKKPLLVLLGLFLAANALYAVKAIVGVDLLPGHHGRLLPFGNVIYHLVRGDLRLPSSRLAFRL